MTCEATQSKKTMTAEEMERGAATVRKALEDAGAAVEDCCDRCHYRAVDTDALAALSRLAAQAARVPGLAAQVEEMQRRAVGAEAERSDLAAKHLAALSERDAARQEAEKLGARARFASEGLLAVVNERDAFRQERDAILTQQQANSKLDLETAAKVESELSALRERVATLEAENEELRGARTVNRNAIRLQQEARDTAQARVKELERVAKDWLAALEADDAACYCEPMETCPPCRVRRALGQTGASQPPPAPAQDNGSLGMNCAWLEPFCACGRRLSQCDSSRKGCKEGVR